MDKAMAERQLEQFDFGALFIETLGWDRFNMPSRVTRVEPGQRGLGPNIQGVPVPRSKFSASLDQQTYTLRGVAQKRGVQVFVCSPDAFGRIPNQPTRQYIQTQVAKQARENLVIYTDQGQSSQVWQWVKRSGGQAEFCEHGYVLGEAADGFLRRLERIVFRLDEEERLSLLDVLTRLETAFHIAREKVRRRPQSRLRLWEYDFRTLDPALGFWLERVYRIPRVTRAEEIELFRDVECGYETGRHRVIEAHLYLVAEMAWKLNRVARLDAQDMLDVIQEGHLELIRAADIFDHSEGWRFQSIAARHLRRVMDRVILEKSRPLPIPNYVGDILPGILQRFEGEEEFQRQARQREPEPAEVAEALSHEIGVRPEDILNLRMLSQGFLSLDLMAQEWEVESQENKHGDEEERQDLCDTLNSEIQGASRQSPSDAAVSLIRREQLDAVLNNLSPRERDVVRMRFGLEDGYAHTLEEVGLRFAVTRERVRQIEIRALKKLRRMVPVAMPT